MFELEKLLYTRDKIKAEMSLYEFFRQSWHVIEPGIPFVDGWHLGAVAEHTQALLEGEIKRLIINVPPRTTKTNLTSIISLPWIWINQPHLRFLCASYGASLSNEHSRKCLDLINSSWYQERFEDRFSLKKQTEALFNNNRGGERIATSIGGMATGKGADILIGDDLNNMSEVNSKAVRESTNNFLFRTFLGRANNPLTARFLFIQQRGHDEDTTGALIKNDVDNEIVKLILPMEFEKSRKCHTVILPSTNGKIWEDPRTEEGELLCPERFPPKVIATYKRELGSYGYAGQHQQRPTPAGGGIIKAGWFKWWKQPLLPSFEFIIQSWDTAFSADKDSAYSACTTWGIFFDQFGVENVMLLSLWKDHLDYPELREMAKRLYRDYRDNGKEPNTKLKGGKRIDLVLVEAKATGTPLIQDLYKAGITCQPFNPTGKGDKINRVHFICPLIEGGRVWLPTDAPTHTTLTTEAQKLIDDAILFPALECNDLIDTMSQALTRFKDGGLLRNPKDIVPLQKTPTPRKFYT